uniref:Uncharacterized protein n=1 Tax=Oryza meridionalis TaxID=40149 RepID=A0A0E0EY82_9ORYZ
MLRCPLNYFSASSLNSPRRYGSGCWVTVATSGNLPTALVLPPSSPIRSQPIRKEAEALATEDHEIDANRNLSTI